MTVVNPDSIAGITSVTSSGTTLEFYDVNGNKLNVSADLTGSFTVGTGATINSPAANAIDFETNGEERARIDSSGRVGIGTNNPAEDLHIGSNSPYILLDDYDNARKWKLKGTAWFAIEDTTAGADRLRITSAGKVGINEADPDEFLHVNGVGAAIKVDSNGDSAFRWATSGTNKYSLYHNNSSNALIFYDNSNSAERIRIDSSGRLLLGTTVSPSSANTLLRVHTPISSSSANSIEIGHDTNGADKAGAALGLAINNGGASTNAADLYFSTATNGSLVQRLWIKSDGKLSLGTSTARQRLHIHEASTGACNLVFTNTTTGTAAADGFIIGLGGGGDPNGQIWHQEAKAIKFATSDTERVRITSDGQLQVLSGSVRITDSGNSTANAAHTTGALRCNLIRSDTSNNNAYTGTYFMNVNAAGGGRKAVGIVETGLKVGDFSSNLAAAETIKLTHDGHVEIKTDGGRLKIGAGNDLQMYHDNGGATNHITCVNNHHLKLSAQSVQFYDYTGVTQYLRVKSGDDRVRVYGESAVDGTSSGADGLSIATGGGTSCPLYFGTETDVAQKSMYLKGYWIYLRGHVNEGMKFIFSQGGAAPHGNIYEFKYNSAKRPGSSTTWDGFSDSRAKENVQSITNGIEKIKQLRPVTYDWTDEYADSTGMWKMDKSDPKEYKWVSKKENGYDTDAKNGQYGFLAQEYETVLPKDVKKEKFKLGDVEISDFRTLNHDSLIATLTAALKESIAKIESLESEVQSIKTQQADDAAYEAKIDKIIDYFKL